jgi:mannose-6-phosphate isomerase-like protein (cupin superfamily)
MTRVQSLLCVAALMAAPLPAASQAPAPAPVAAFPAPGSPGFFRGGPQLTATLRQAAAASNAVAESPVLVTDRTSIKLMRRGEPNAPAVHPGWTEVHYILDGGGVLETGGVERRVKAGDVVLIPDNAIHRYKSLDGFVTYAEIRFPNVPPPVAAPAPATPFSPLPAPGSAGVFSSGAQLAATIAAALAAKTEPAVAPILVTDRYAVDLVRRDVAGAAAVHDGWNELHFITAGGGTLTTGGVAQALHQGDMLIVPANASHQYTSVEGQVTYFEVRFPNAPPAPPR